MRPRCLFELNMVSFVGLIMPIANPNKTTHRLTVIVYKASRLGLKCRYQFPTRLFFFFFFGCVHADTISSWFRLQNWPYWGGKKCSSLQVSSPSPECSLNISPILSSYTIIRMCPCNLKLHREEGHPTIIMPSTSLELTREGQIGQG